MHSTTNQYYANIRRTDGFRLHNVPEDIVQKILLSLDITNSSKIS